MPEPQPAAPPVTPPSADTLSPTLLALLCCPLCPERPPLRLADNDPNRLVCDLRGHVFPIHDGLPDLRPESATLPTGDASPAPSDAVS